MPRLNVDLPADLVRFIESEVSAGGYASISDVVGRAVSMMRAGGPPDRPDDGMLREALRRGLDDVEAGRISTRTARDIARGIAMRADGN